MDHVDHRKYAMAMELTNVIPSYGSCPPEWRHGQQEG